MDILFINSVRYFQLKEEVNGTLLLATLLKKAGFHVDILRFAQIENFRKNYNDFIEEITEKVLAINPTCVSFYSLWPEYHIMLRIARELKERNNNIVVVMGGPVPTATAQATMQAMPFVDYICAGEGECKIVPFFASILRNNKVGLDQIPGIYYRNGLQIVETEGETPSCDLNTLPYWDDSLLLDTRGENKTGATYLMPIDVGRGCPFTCTFCCSSLFWKRKYRLKSAQRIVEEICYYKEKYGITSFRFSHDAFTVNQDLVEEVCDCIIEKNLNIQWACTSRINCLSKELILKMKKAGLKWIELGIETGSVKMQQLIKKNLDLEKVHEMVEFLVKNQFQVYLFFMYGFPQETEQDLRDTLKLLFDCKDQGVTHTDMFFCRFNPSTEMTKQYFDELIFNPNINILYRGVYGVEEEREIIMENKELFSFFYHFNTPVRNNYQYLQLLNFLYQKFPVAAKSLRKLYDGDDIAFYKDFCDRNPSLLDKTIQYAAQNVLENPLDILNNMIDAFDAPFVPQLKELARYEWDVYRVSRAKEDICITQTYDFNFLEYKLNIPIQRYSAGKSKIMISKINGEFSQKLMQIGK